MVSLLLAGLFAFAVRTALAYDAPRVIINEIMYNPQSGVDGDEFVELYNTTGGDINLSGWCFTNGITMCFGDITIAANDYVIISPDGNRTTSTYGETTVGTYTGKLDNGGERLTLSDENGIEVNSLVYDDVSPWPTSPDGGGKSLELKDPTLDNRLASSWAASLSAPTPSAENSVVNANPPTISDVTKPTDVDPSEAVTIVATVENAATIDLKYKVMFNSEQTVTMLDDGAHGDGAAGDNVYGAQIPGQAAGELVRYKIHTANIGSILDAPSNDESINYYGYVVTDPSEAVTGPILNMFMADDDFDQMMLEDRMIVGNFNQYPAVITYGDQVFDNARVRIKGEYSSSLEFPKRPYKVDLPSGYTLNIPEIASYPLPQFHLNSDFPKNSYVSSLAAWDVATSAGLADHSRGKVLVRRNGDTLGAYTMMVKFDRPWRARNFSASGSSYDSGVLYEDFWELNSGSDPGNTLRDGMVAGLSSGSADSKKQYLMDNIEIPNLLNYASVMSVIRQHDWSFETNMMMFLDQAGNGRWSFQPWDFDLASQSLWDGETVVDAGMDYMINPADIPVYLQNVGSRRLGFDQIWGDDTLREMYARRVRNLIDDYFASGQYEAYLQDQLETAQSILDEDYTAWFDYELGQGIYPFINQYLQSNNIPNDSNIVDVIYSQLYGPDWDSVEYDDDMYTMVKPMNPHNRIQFQKYQYRMMIETWLSKYVDEGLLPESEPVNPSIKITEINYNPAVGQGGEYIELYNPNDTAIDLSGWKIQGVDMTLPGGAVLPSKGYGVVVKEDQQFRTFYSGGKYVLGSYAGSLANEGETIRLVREDDSMVDQVSYAPNGSWPSAANGGGKSLELISLTANSAKPSCWAPSSEGGTPDAGNQPDQSWVSANSAACFATSDTGGANGNSADGSAKTTSAALSSGNVPVNEQVPGDTEQSAQSQMAAGDDTNDDSKTEVLTDTSSKQEPVNYTPWVLVGVASFGVLTFSLYRLKMK